MDKDNKDNGNLGTPLSKKFRTDEKLTSTECLNVSTSSKTTSKKSALSKLANGSDNLKINIKNEEKTVDPMILFGGETKRKPMPKIEKRSKDLSHLVFEDDEIEESMVEIADETVILKNKSSPHKKNIPSSNNKKTKNSPKDKFSNSNMPNAKSKNVDSNQNLETSKNLTFC